MSLNKPNKPTNCIPNCTSIRRRVTSRKCEPFRIWFGGIPLPITVSASKSLGISSCKITYEIYHRMPLASYIPSSRRLSDVVNAFGFNPDVRKESYRLSTLRLDSDRRLNPLQRRCSESQTASLFVGSCHRLPSRCKQSSISWIVQGASDIVM